MDKPTPLFRSDNFPYEPEKFDNLGHHLIETAQGWYRIDLDLDTDEFVLTTPQGKEIKDTLTEVHLRKDLYQLFEDGMIFEWIKMVQNKVNRVRSNEGETRTQFKIDGHKYMMRVNTQSGEVLLTMPKHTRAFTAKSMYTDYIDFPAIHEGLLDDYLRRRFKQFDLEMVPSPYKVGLGLTEK